MASKTTKNNETQKTVFNVRGVLTRMRYEIPYRSKSNDKRWNISVKVNGGISEDTRKKILVATGLTDDSAFTPKFLKEEGCEYINAHTRFEIPVALYANGRKIPLAMADVFEGANVELSLVCKEGAIYPRAMMVYKNGTPFDPFADFSAPDCGFMEVSDDEELPFD